MNNKKNDSSLFNEQAWIKISDCDPDSFINKAVALTFDIDWVCDEILNECIDLVENAGVAATWFVTHDTPALERLRAVKEFELGIHPNFNPLLDGKGGSAEYIIDQMLELVPEAVSVRSHSLVQSSRLHELFHRKGLIFDCNDFISQRSKIILQPWRLWNGMIKVPHFWEDDAECIYKTRTSMHDLLAHEGIKVFDFHPIHVFLNTEDLTRYDKTREFHSIPEELLKYRFKGKGTRTMLLNLLSEFKNA